MAAASSPQKSEGTGPCLISSGELYVPLLGFTQFRSNRLSTLKLVVLDNGKSCRMGDQLLEEGAQVSLDGHSGRGYAGKLEVVVERPTAYLHPVDRWKVGPGKTPAFTS
jgi:hypothetical protein